MLRFIEGFELITSTGVNAGAGQKGIINSSINGFDVDGTTSIVSGRNGSNSLLCSSKKTAGSSPSSFFLSYPLIQFLAGSRTLSSYFSEGTIGFAVNFSTPNSTDQNNIFFTIPNYLYLVRKNKKIYLYMPKSPAGVTYTNKSGFFDSLGYSYTLKNIIYDVSGTWNPLAVSSNFIFNDNYWYYLEVKFKLGLNGGIEIKCDEISVLNYQVAPGQYFTPTGTGITYNNLFSYMTLGLSLLVNSTSPTIIDSSTCSHNFDDVYLVDTTGTQNNNFLGNISIKAIQPSSNNSVQFTPIGAATNWQAVNDSDPNGNTNYNYSTEIVFSDIYNMTSLTSTSTIFGMDLSVNATQFTGGPAVIKPLANISSNSYYANSLSFLKGIYLTYDSILENNPATSLPWTTADINSAKFGYLYDKP